MADHCSTFSPFNNGQGNGCNQRPTVAAAAVIGGYSQSRREEENCRLRLSWDVKRKSEASRLLWRRSLVNTHDRGAKRKRAHWHTVRSILLVVATHGDAAAPTTTAARGGGESGKWGGPQTPVWRRESNQMWENRLKVSLRYITTFHLKQVSFFLFFLNHSGHVFVSYFLMDGIDSLWDGAAPEQKEVRHSFVNLWDACLVSRQVVSFISKEIRVTEWTLCRVGQSLVIAAGGGQADDAATLFGLGCRWLVVVLRYRFRTTHFFWHPFSFSC